MRAFKTVNDSYIEPISFIVPRRAEVFQDDIFPPPVGSKPAMSATEWFNGKVALPPKIDLASVYAGEEVKEVASDSQPSVTNIAVSASPLPISKSLATDDNQPPVLATKGPPPSMNQQTASIKGLAQKFNDNEEGDEDDASSFEEVSKPERSVLQNSDTVASSNEVSKPPTASGQVDDAGSASKDKRDDLDSPIQFSATHGMDQVTPGQQKQQAVGEATPTSEQLATGIAEPGQNKFEGSEVRQSLAEIRSLLEEQRKAMDAQNNTIGRLTAEVDRLRSKMDDS